MQIGEDYLWVCYDHYLEYEQNFCVFKVPETCIPSDASRGWLHCFQQAAWLYVGLWENDEFMVSVTSFTSSTQHDVVIMVPLSKYGHFWLKCEIWKYVSAYLKCFLVVDD